MLVALAFSCFVLGVLGFMFLVINRHPRDAGGEADRLWHRWEEGDLTTEEFERLRRAGRVPSVRESRR